VWMPGEDGVTNQTDRITELWVGSWIAAMIVGVAVWGLTIWCVVAYRRRKDETGLPAQVRYNLPIEVLYTTVPFIIIAVLFYFTARDIAAIEDREGEPDLTINAVAKQWSWDFNYVDDDVYETGIQAPLDGRPGVAEELPTLVLPVGERVEFVLTARDVIHSFWVPAFLYKKDMIPGRTNYFQVVPEREGTYAGKCAELCGEYHSEMLFQVEVVSRAEYDAYIETLRDRGQTGQLGADLNVFDVGEQDEQVEGNPTDTDPNTRPDTGEPLSEVDGEQGGN
jgi:cytochrome c oxidase subunit II